MKAFKLMKYSWLAYVEHNQMGGIRTRISVQISAVFYNHLWSNKMINNTSVESIIIIMRFVGSSLLDGINDFPVITWSTTGLTQVYGSTPLTIVSQHTNPVQWSARQVSTSVLPLLRWVPPRDAPVSYDGAAWHINTWQLRLRARARHWEAALRTVHGRLTAVWREHCGSSGLITFFSLSSGRMLRRMRRSQATCWADCSTRVTTGYGPIYSVSDMLSFLSLCGSLLTSHAPIVDYGLWKQECLGSDKIIKS